MADVSDNRLNVPRENDQVGDLDVSVSQAITTVVLASVEESKPDHCMFKQVFLYQRQIYVDLMAGIVVCNAVAMLVYIWNTCL